MRKLLFILFAVSFSFAGSSQEYYPWGHQVLHLRSRLTPAGPLPERFHAYVGNEYLHESRLPLYALPRTLYKPFVMGFYFRDAGGLLSVDAAWDLVCHSEANHPFKTTVGDVRFYSTLNLLQSGVRASARFGAKLPNAPNEYGPGTFALNAGLSGAGSDNTDFSFFVLLSCPLGPIWLDANGGLILLDSPTGISQQLDAYDASIGVRFVNGPLQARLETNRVFGPRRFDNYHDIVLKADCTFQRIFLGIKQGFGLNGSTDDIQSGLYVGFKIPHRP